MPVIMAKYAGFCFGVKRAVNAVEKEISKGNPNIFTFGEIIHNKQVVEDFISRGVRPIDSLAGIAHGSTVIIRAHGIGPQLQQRATELGINLIDATCPFVRRVQKLAREYSEKGYAVFVVGQASHPEVCGICDHSIGKATVIEFECEGEKNDDDLDSDQEYFRHNHTLKCIDMPKCASYDELESCANKSRKTAQHVDFDSYIFPQKGVVLAQTTIKRSSFDYVISALNTKVEELIVFDTICETTDLRQKETKSLAMQSDTVLVLGSKHSSNTQKLYQIAKKYCINAFIIENHVDSALEKIHVSDIISIIAGASTPNWMMMEVFTRMNDLDKTTVDVSGQQSEEILTGAESSIAETATDSGADSDFMAALDKTLVRIRNGQVLTGTVVQVTDNEVSVNIGYKSDGFIPQAEFSSDPDVNLVEAVKVGDEIEVEVIKVNDSEGNVLLSHKSVEARKAWDSFVDHAEEEGAVFDAVGREVVKGGLIAYIQGVRTFIPASHVSNRYVENLSEFIGQPLRLKILEVDRNKRRVVASQKTVLIEEAAEKKREIWNSIEVGQRCKGVVRRLTDFGGFVDIGGIDGLVHVTEMAWGRVKHPKDIFKEGDEIEVIVKSLDLERERISLGYKELLPDPWSAAAEKYPVGSIVEGKVVRIKPFGAFVSLEPRIDGLVHISQVATKRIEKIEDELKIGDIIRSKVLSVDVDAKRISLSRREVLLEEESLEDMLEPVIDSSMEEEQVVEETPIEAATTSMAEIFPSLSLDDEISSEN